MLTLPRWVDADTIILNPNIPLNIFLPPAEFSHLHLLVTADPHGLNNGVFFIKVHPWSVELLSAVVAYRMYRPYAELQYRDQSALVSVLEERHFKKNYSLLPQRWINAIWIEGGDETTKSFQVQPGHLLVHFPGHPQRDEIMKKYLDRVDRHMKEWELDYKSTNYSAEINEYWAQQQGILEEQKAEALSIINDAKELLTKVNTKMTAHQTDLDSDDADRIGRRIKSLKIALHVNINDTETIQQASDNLREVRFTKNHNRKNPLTTHTQVHQTPPNHRRKITGINPHPSPRHHRRQRKSPPNHQKHRVDRGVPETEIQARFVQGAAGQG